MQPQQYQPYSANIQKPRRQLIVFGILAIVLLAIGWSLWKYFVQEKVVTLQATSDTTITLGTSGNSENGPSISKTLIQTSSSASKRLGPGTYTAKFTSDGYATQYQTITVQSNTTVTSPKLTYTTQKLSDLLQQNAPAIRASLSAATSLADYSLQAEKLYDNGDWYAAKLIPSDPTNNDTKLVIMNNQNGQWKLVAGPSVIFYILNYPKIPADVIRDINNR